MIALNPCGGGSRGPISYGALKYLHEIGLKPDAVYASSVGALNSIMYLQDELPGLEDLWLNIKNDDVYNKRILSLWQLLTSSASIYDSKPLEKLIRKVFNKEKIDNLKIPFYVSVSNISELRPEMKDIRGLPYEDQIKWILASASPPILFPPILSEMSLLVDAGICNNYMIQSAINDGYDTVICITPTNYQSKPPKNIIDIIQATVSTATFNYLDREVKAVEKINKVIDAANIELVDDIRKIKLIIIRPPVKWDQPLLDFNYKVDRKQLIQFGYNIAKEAMKDFDKLT